MQRFIISFVLLSAITVPAMAVTFQLDFGRVVTSSGTPGGTGPFATAKFEDIAANTVRFTFTHSATSAVSQKIKDAWFTVDPTIASVQSTFVSDTSGKFDGFSFGQNSKNAALGASFDMKVAFKSSQSGFAPGDTLVLNLSGNGLNANSFDFLTSANTIGATPAMIHLLGIDGGGSAHLDPIPEPATMALAAPVALAWWRKRKKSA